MDGLNTSEGFRHSPRNEEYNIHSRYAALLRSLDIENFILKLLGLSNRISQRRENAEINVHLIVKGVLDENSLLKSSIENAVVETTVEFLRNGEKVKDKSYPPTCLHEWLPHYPSSEISLAEEVPEESESKRQELLEDLRSKIQELSSHLACAESQRGTVELWAHQFHQKLRSGEVSDDKEMDISFEKCEKKIKDLNHHLKEAKKCKNNMKVLAEQLNLRLTELESQKDHFENSYKSELQKTKSKFSFSSSYSQTDPDGSEELKLKLEQVQKKCDDLEVSMSVERDFHHKATSALESKLSESDKEKQEIISEFNECADELSVYKARCADLGENLETALKNLEVSESKYRQLEEAVRDLVELEEEKDDESLGRDRMVNASFWSMKSFSPRIKSSAQDVFDGYRRGASSSSYREDPIKICQMVKKLVAEFQSKKEDLRSLELYKQLKKEDSSTQTDDNYEKVLQENVVTKMKLKKIESVSALTAKYQEKLQEELEKTKLQLAAEQAERQVTAEKLAGTKTELEETKTELEETKTKLKKLESASALTEKYKEKIQEELEETKLKLAAEQTERRANAEKLAGTQTELEKTHTQLEKTQTERKETKTELEKTQTQLKETKTELGETKTELEETKSELEETNTELKETKTKLKKVETVSALMAKYKVKIQEELQETKLQLAAEQAERQADAEKLSETRTELKETKTQLDETTATYALMNERYESVVRELKQKLKDAEDIIAALTPPKDDKCIQTEGPSFEEATRELIEVREHYLRVLRELEAEEEESKRTSVYHHSDSLAE